MNSTLKKQLAYVYDNSSFYKKKWGLLNREEILDSDNFRNLPFTTKSEILSDQAQNPPFGSNLCVNMSSIRRIHKTSGTTNAPVIIALTENDIAHVVEVGGACFTASGLTQQDTVMHCLNYNMWAGGFTDHQSLERTGATVVPFGVGNTKLLIEMILRLQATAIHCTPSYLSKIEQVLQDDFNMSPRDLNLRLALLGAESGLQNPVFRKSIEDKWGFRAMNANYGLSEVLSMIGAECRLQRGLHFWADEKLLLEIVDVETGQSLEIEEGVTGEMVLTNLIKESQPLVRYRTGDIIRINDFLCPCGCGKMTFEIIGRTDDMLVIRGLNVFVSSINDVLVSFFPRITSEYRILISRNDPVERVKIQVECNDNNSTETLDEEICGKLRTLLSLNLEVEVLKKNSFERTEGKSKRVWRVLD